MSKIKHILICVLTLIGLESSVSASHFSIKPERIYFDAEEMPMGEDAFHVPVGNNEWVQSSCIHRDTTGFFTYTSDIKREPHSTQYVKEWKCPYCHLYWPIGTPCGNAACPSKYR